MSDFSNHEVTVKVKMRVSAYDADDAIDVAIGLLLPVAGVMFVDGKVLEHSMSDAILEQHKSAAYEEGIKYALDYLSALYDGIEETDLWTEYMPEEAN